MLQDEHAAAVDGSLRAGALSALCRADEKAAGTPRRSGSLESAASGVYAAPPAFHLAEPAACGKLVDKLVGNVGGADRPGGAFSDLTGLRRYKRRSAGTPAQPDPGCR